MPSREAYEQSGVDWPRLHAYAKRVARETHKPVERKITYSETIYENVPVERPKRGPLRMFQRTIVENHRRRSTQVIQVADEHWILDKRHHHIEKNTNRTGTKYQETINEQISFILLPDGALKHVALYEEEFTSVSKGEHAYRGDRSHSVRDLNEWDLRSFDFEKRYAEHGSHGVGTKWWGDREPGRRLLVHSKGVGLSLALKRLLE